MIDDIVLGVRWDPHDDERGRDAVAADLDAMCELRDAHGRLLELVGPGRLRNGNGSVIHTGDSRTGAGDWDDERIFVFVGALPGAVHSLVFTVASCSTAPFGDIAGASCHVSDHSTEDPLLSVQLSSLGAATEHAVATLRRTEGGWSLVAGRASVG